MTTPTATTAAASPSEVFGCLAEAERRRLLGLLHDAAPESVTARDLATALAAERADTSREDVDDEARRAARTDLYHRHLPKLEAAGLIERDEETDAVGTADHPALTDDGVREAIAGDAPADAASLDELFGALAEERRRTVLDVLSHQYHSIRIDTLARDLVARDPDAPDPSTEDAAEAVARARRSLRHAVLPALAEADLVDYDAGEGTVAYTGHPALRVPWMHSAFSADFRAGLTETPAEAEVWSLEGRETVVSCGQSLFDEADEELFLLFTDTDLLEAGCFARIEQAAARGVDVYLGTRDPVVREFVTERAPDVTLWEPETNWLDLPVGEERVGRLVFADREALMIGTLGEEGDDGVREEAAVVGEGADNTLVVLVRQLLQSQFDEFEAASEAEAPIRNA